jgi:hemoglobin-like flavoprotein
MSNVKTASTIENIIDEMHQLSEDQQRALAGAILEDRN